MHCQRARVVIVTTLLAVCIFAGVGVGIGTASATGGTATSGVMDSASFQSEQTAANSSDQSAETTPPRHRNPDEIEDSANIDQLESALRSSVDGDLGAAIDSLDDQQYEQAREQFGDEFEENLRRYVEASSEIDADEEAELLSSIADDQQAYIDAVESYDTTADAYESAQESGDTAQTRELGRELIEHAERVIETGRTTADNYRQLGNITDQEYTDRVESIEQQRSRADETATTVADEQFTETSLSVSTDQSTVEFTDVVLLTGEIQTADGSGIGSQQATIEIQDEQQTVAVDADGTFETTIEPSGTWETTDELRISYHPENDSALFGSETTIPLSVETTETRVELDTVSDQASYDSPLAISGQLLTAETGEPVPAAPISVRIDGSELNTTETDSGGQFSVDSPLPVGVAAGETTVSVQLSPSPFALSGGETEVTIPVEETDAVLSLSATTVEGVDAETLVAVDGVLESPAGRPIADETVTVAIDGEVVGEAVTDSEGTFTEQFAPPEQTNAGSTATVDATFDPDGSSLSAESASTTVELPETLLESVGLSTDDALIFGGAAVIGLLGVLGGAGWWLRRTPEQAALSVGESGDSAPASPVVDTETLLTAATEQLDNGANEAAATMAYMATRQQLSEDVAADETATHWEWYQDCVAAGVDQVSELETLVEAFEQVTFARDSSQNAAAAQRAVSTAQQVVAAEG